jgi:hypothetical protein
MSPKLTSANATSPRLEGHLAMSAWIPSSTMSSAASSPPRGHSISGIRYSLFFLFQDRSSSEDRSICFTNSKGTQRKNFKSLTVSV